MQFPRRFPSTILQASLRPWHSNCSNKVSSSECFGNSNTWKFSKWALIPQNSRIINFLWPESRRYTVHVRAWQNQKSTCLTTDTCLQIMKSDEDVRMISAEAPVLFAKVGRHYKLEDLQISLVVCILHRLLKLLYASRLVRCLSWS